MSTAIRNILSCENKFGKVARMAFDSVDTDKSGEIDSKELEKIMVLIASDMGAEPPSNEDVKLILSHLDEDKSGKIDFNEFKTLIRDLLESMLEEE